MEEGPLNVGGLIALLQTLDPNYPVLIRNRGEVRGIKPSDIKPEYMLLLANCNPNCVVFEVK